MIRQTLAALASPARRFRRYAAQLTVEEIDADSRQFTVYQCANQKQPVRVSYWLAGGALVPVNGKQMLFVDGVGVGALPGRPLYVVDEGQKRRCARDRRPLAAAAGRLRTGRKKKKG